MPKNIEAWNKKITEEDKHLIVDQYVNHGKSANEIIKLLNYKFKTTKTIYDVLKSFGCITKDKSFYASVDHFYFNKIDTPNKAYILGLMVTDGWVHCGEKHPNQVGIQLHEKDLDIIEFIKSEWKTENKIVSCYKKETLYPNGKIYQPGIMKRILVHSAQMQKDLAKFGVVERKSSICILPILDKSLMSHLFRGIVDGDGSIYIHSDGKTKCIRFLGSHYLVAQVILYLHMFLGLTLRTPSARENISLVDYSSKKDTSKLLNWLYKDIEKSKYIKRKYEIYQS